MILYIFLLLIFGSVVRFRFNGGKDIGQITDEANNNGMDGIGSLIGVLAKVISERMELRKDGVTVYSYNTYFQHISSSIVDYCVHPSCLCK